MNHRGDNDHYCLDLNVYADGDEATLLLTPEREAAIEQYDEDDIATLPWARPFV